MDDLISFRQLSKKATADFEDVSLVSQPSGTSTAACSEHGAAKLTLQVDMDVGRATGAAEVQDDFVSKLSRIVQLTGELDPADSMITVRNRP